MPKDCVWSRYQEDDNLRVHVGWAKDNQHVEVATLMDGEKALVPTPEGNGWFVSLDRPGINRLIRLLRQARDQAFGRDE